MNLARGMVFELLQIWADFAIHRVVLTGRNLFHLR
jgi:hypothetical protein